MEIVFSGICCFVDAPPSQGGKTVIVRNALRGGMHRSNLIPPHYAFVHAKREHVNSQNWGSGWLASEDNVLLWLTGDHLTIDPMPGGGTIELDSLPHVLGTENVEPICAAAHEIRHGFREDPNAFNVLALIDLPADAPVTSTTNVKGAAYATLHIDTSPVTITATPFDGVGVSRSFTITDPDAVVFISNVDINSYLLGEGATDDEHRYLICELFRPRRTQPGLPLPELINAPQPVASLSSVEPAPRVSTPLNQLNFAALEHAAQRGMPDFLSTFAAGCSASQWP